MIIHKKRIDNQLELLLEGRLDTNTAPELEKMITDYIGGITLLTLDFQNLDYLSSAGLRVILGAQKIMNKQGKMKVIHVNSTIMEVFEVTGFVDILSIE